MLEAPLSKALSSSDNWQPLLTVLDLASAYKQFAIHPSCRKYSIVALKRPGTNAVQCFEGLVLPFGSTASVVHFNRVSKLLHSIGFRLNLLWGSFYDDFPILSQRCLADTTLECAISLLKLLGFAFSEHKLKPFADRATVLGVEVDLAGVATDDVKVRNKPGRVEEIDVAVQSLLEKGTATASECSKIIGRLQYADSQVMGRTGRLALAELREAVRAPCKSVMLSNAAVESFKNLVARITGGLPRSIPCGEPCPPLLVYTDGASEQDLHTVGGILVAPRATRCRYFSAHVPKRLVAVWKETMKHVIGPVELYAVVLARYTWHEYLVQGKSIYFVDSYAALDSCIKGTSTNDKFRRLLLAFEEADLRGHTWSLFSRIPSKSNPADDPSRGERSTVVTALNAVRDQCSCPITGLPLEPL